MVCYKSRRSPLNHSLPLSNFDPAEPETLMNAPASPLNRGMPGMLSVPRQLSFKVQEENVIKDPQVKNTKTHILHWYEILCGK